MVFSCVCMGKSMLRIEDEIFSHHGFFGSGNHPILNAAGANKRSLSDQGSHPIVDFR